MAAARTVKSRLISRSAVGFLARPFGPEELTARVREALSI
jgi:DNA-binding response OmpR family regulator